MPLISRYTPLYFINYQSKYISLLLKLLIQGFCSYINLCLYRNKLAQYRDKTPMWLSHRLNQLLCCNYSQHSSPNTHIHCPKFLYKVYTTNSIARTITITPFFTWSLDSDCVGWYIWVIKNWNKQWKIWVCYF